MEKIHLLKKMSENISILYVEDDEAIGNTFTNYLKKIFTNVDYCKNGIEGLEQYKLLKHKIVITDIMMPEMNGIEMSREIKKINNEQNIIITSAYSDTEKFIESIKLGIDGYIIKPIDYDNLNNVLYKIIKKIKTFEEHAMYEKDLEKKVEEATKEIIDLNEEIEKTQREVVFTLGAIAETRSKETGNHVKRVAEYSKQLALYYGMGEDEAELLKQASPMHDIGKVGIPDSILNKPSKLDKNEIQIMQTHAELGYDMLCKSDRPLLKTAAIVAYEHHENWDGTGYPRKIEKNDIHVYGRITAIADVFDALSSDRCYKKAWEDEKILEYLHAERGKKFDPELIDLFFKNIDTFLKIRDYFKDSL